MNGEIFKFESCIMHIIITFSNDVYGNISVVAASGLVNMTASGVVML